MADFDARTPGATAINPATGKMIEHCPWLHAAGRVVAHDIAVAGFQAWRDMPLAARAEVLVRVAGHLREELAKQVERSVTEGATLLLEGGVTVDAAGAFYAPTILSNVTPGMTPFREETFGSLAAIVVARDAEHALALANDREFGLSGAIGSGDVARATALARRMETGGVFINGFAASDPRTPIGGIKKSGYGRELSHFGIRASTNAQIVWLDRA